MNIVVSKKNFNNPEKEELVWDMIDFVNAMLDGFYYPEELPPAAMKSYYADYYLTQVNNGGISQFIFNTGWHPEAVMYVKAGLTALGAARHLELFDKVEAEVALLGDDLDNYLEEEYFGENETRDRFEQFSETFRLINADESIMQLNHDFIKALPDLEVLKEPDYSSNLKRLAAAVPNRAQREREALENEPEEFKKIREVCQIAHLQVVSFNAVDPIEYDGQTTEAWHISTDKGYYFAVFLGRKVYLHNGDSEDVIADCDY